MNSLQDLAVELARRGVYCVLNANIPRDVGPRDVTRKAGVDVPLACGNRAKRSQATLGKVAIAPGRDLGDKRDELRGWGYELVQITEVFLVDEWTARHVSGNVQQRPGVG